jgi:hypothetical protein
MDGSGDHQAEKIRQNSKENTTCLCTQNPDLKNDMDAKGDIWG